MTITHKYYWEMQEELEDACEHKNSVERGVCQACKKEVIDEPYDFDLNSER